MKPSNSEHYSSEELKGLAEAFNYQEWIVDQFRPYLHGRVMDIGAGIGTMAKKWLPFSDELHLVEPAKNLFSILQSNLNLNPKVLLHQGSLDEVLSNNPELKKKLFDSIVMVNVLEHIKNDSQVLNLVNKILIPGGYLLIFVPAMPVLYGSLDREFGHYRRYTKIGLKSICQIAGYEISYIRYFDLFGAIPWWFVNRILCSSTLNQNMAKLYDRFVVPVARGVEKIVTPPFGKNLILVGRKTRASLTI